MIKKFPIDCSYFCPHFDVWDKGIDDWTCKCDLLKVQIDDCDAYDGLHPLPLCPLENEE